MRSYKMFEGCTIKYLKDENNNNYAVNIIYPTNSDGSIKKITAPMDNENTHYQAILAWVADGNTIEEAD